MLVSYSKGKSISVFLTPPQGQALRVFKKIFLQGAYFFEKPCGG